MVYSNLNFAGYTGSKNPVQTRQKIQFIKFDFSKIKCRLRMIICIVLYLTNLFFEKRGYLRHVVTEPLILLQMACFDPSFTASRII